jgi:hypothetical protein
MKAIFQRLFWLKSSVAGLFGAAVLLLAACGTHGNWPNLASVPPREEAFRPTVTSSAAGNKVLPEADRKQARDEAKAAFLDIQGDIPVLGQQFETAKSNSQAEAADYEKALRRLSGEDKSGGAALTTAQLYLSRLTRSRDNLRRMAEKIESRERDLLEIKARIAGLEDEGLASEAGDLSEKLSPLSEAVAIELNRINPYAAGELARLKLLSEEEAADAAAISPEGEEAPVLVWRANEGEAVYRAGLEGLLKGRAGNPRYLVQIAGDEAALANKNSLLIRAMGDLMAAGVALDHIVLAVKADPAAAHPELRLYIVSR